MKALQDALLLLMLSAAVLALPWLPALVTLRRRPSSPAPDTPGTDPAAEADALRRRVGQDFSTLIRLARENGTIRSANEHDRPLLVLGLQSHLADQLKPGSKRLRACVLATGHLDVPGELICDREIYAEGRINLAHHTIARALLSPRDIAIGPHARITRWVRSDRRLDVAEGARLRGWASAGIEASLARHARFRRVTAPLIRLGRPREGEHMPHPPDTVGHYLPPRRSDSFPGNGRNLTIPPRHVVKDDLILAGTLSIGDGCHLIGQIRADKGIITGADVRIDGAVHADGPVRLGPRNHISGPVVSSEEISCGPACVFGNPAGPTTLSADTLRLGEGSIAHGTLDARREGEVVGERPHP